MQPKETLGSGYTTCVQNSLNNPQNCEWNDVTFVVGKEEKTFKGIKALFAMHSAVFKLNER